MKQTDVPLARGKGAKGGKAKEGKKDNVGSDFLLDGVDDDMPAHGDQKWVQCGG